MVETGQMKQQNSTNSYLVTCYFAENEPDENKNNYHASMNLEEIYLITMNLEEIYLVTCSNQPTLILLQFGEIF